MEELGIGKVITTYQKRDAIHIAIFPGIAAEELKAGQHVGIVDEEEKSFGKVKDTVGIVDPYLARKVQAGEKFWVFLYPNTVTSLKHNWTHPAFGNEIPDVNAFQQIRTFESKKWLENFANDIGLTYSELMNAADYAAERDDDDWSSYVTIGVDTPYDKIGELWEHYAKVRGVKLPKGFARNFFSCAC